MSKRGIRSQPRLFRRYRSVHQNVILSVNGLNGSRDITAKNYRRLPTPRAVVTSLVEQVTAPENLMSEYGLVEYCPNENKLFCHRSDSNVIDVIENASASGIGIPSLV